MEEKKPTIAGHDLEQRAARPFRRRPDVRRKACRLCVDNVDHLDYKNSQYLRSFVMDSGKILSRRITGTCAQHQRQLSRAIKRNRNMAILPYTTRIR